MNTATDKKNLLDEFYSTFNASGHQTNPAQRQAMEWLMTKGLPHLKSEEYRFTPIVRTLEKVFDPSPGAIIHKNVPDADLSLIPRMPCNVIAFINGVFSRTQSIILDDGLHINSSDSTLANEDDDPFALLNHAFTSESIHISTNEGIAIKHPVAIVYYFDTTTFAFSNPRWSCTVGRHSSLTLLEYEINAGAGKHFNNKQTDILVAEFGQLEYTVIQNGLLNTVQINNTRVHLASSAHTACFTFSFDGQLVRNNLTLILDGEKIDAHLYGLYMVTKNTLVDNHTVVDHRKPNSFSNQLYKGVMDGNSRGVFNGKIYVRSNAQKTNAFQSNRNILLGDNTTVNTKPQLEIWADDVKCSHGCTTGQLDEEALFYLQSRGIGKDMAKGMLLTAFATETVASMKHTVIKNFLESIISTRLQSSN